MPTDVWLPIATLILGYAGSLITESRRDARVRARDREAREAARQTTRDERRDELQRRTLLELQDALANFTRVSFQMHTEGRRNSRSEERALLATVQLNVLATRLLDDELRALVQSVQAASEAITIAPRGSPEEADRAEETITERFTKANDRAGELLRSLY